VSGAQVVELEEVRGAKNTKSLLDEIVDNSMDLAA
jgi:hypothetical protein